MEPQIELYVHADCPWVTEQLVARFQQALQRLVSDLLSAPQGPEPVLGTLPVVEISVVDDATIAAVHAEFLHDPSPTDAITFQHGEILVSCDTAARYAAQHALLREEELFRYMVHGLTHLHGYRDYEPAEREALFAVQEPLVERYYPRAAE